MTPTREDLLKAETLPCRKCGADIEIGRIARMSILRERIKWMQREAVPSFIIMEREGWTIKTYRLEDDIAELEKMPGIICGYPGHRASRVHSVNCAGCGAIFTGRRSTAKWCSGKCRVAGHRSASGSHDSVPTSS